MSRLHKMQAAIALSPTNKACTMLENGDTFIIQEYLHEHYRMWVVSPTDTPIWGGELSEQELDELPAKYKAHPGRQVWLPMGTADYQAIEGAAQVLYQSMETALQALAGQILSLRTELLVIKRMVKRDERHEED